MLLLVLPPLALLAVLLVLTARKGNGASLADVPGYDIGFPAGELITTTKVSGLLGAASQEDRVYGTAADPTEIAASFERSLSGAGYRQVAPPEPPAPGDRFLGRYQLGQARWLVILRDLPARIDGHTYEIGERGFVHVVVVRIER
ncbi:MAG: hypothetical protein ABIY58_00990 [Acidimicrobiales bacterium]